MFGEIVIFSHTPQLKHFFRLADQCSHGKGLITASKKRIFKEFFELHPPLLAPLNYHNVQLLPRYLGQTAITSSVYVITMKQYWKNSLSDLQILLSR